MITRSVSPCQRAWITQNTLTCRWSNTSLELTLAECGMCWKALGLYIGHRIGRNLWKTKDTEFEGLRFCQDRLFAASLPGFHVCCTVSYYLRKGLCLHPLAAWSQVTVLPPLEPAGTVSQKGSRSARRALCPQLDGSLWSQGWAVLAQVGSDLGACTGLMSRTCKTIFALRTPWMA